MIENGAATSGVTGATCCRTTCRPCDCFAEGSSCGQKPLKTAIASCRPTCTGLKAGVNQSCQQVLRPSVRRRKKLECVDFINTGFQPGASQQPNGWPLQRLSADPTNDSSSFTTASRLICGSLVDNLGS